MAFFSLLLTLIYICRSESVQCIQRSATWDERWVLSRDPQTFCDNIATHNNSDCIIDGKRIQKYRLLWFGNGKWSPYYYPGKNDIVDSHKNEDVWNEKTFKCGRRQWTMFIDHTHEVCYHDTIQCDRLHQTTGIPTPNPLHSPTATPSIIPSANPSKAPTSKPSYTPTTNPSKVPTSHPSSNSSKLTS